MGCLVAIVECDNPQQFLVITLIAGSPSNRVRHRQFTGKDEVPGL